MNGEIAFVVMAAGIGRRYDGTKQLRTFGRRNLTIAEYNILHAIDSGFKNFYFVICDRFAEIFHKRLKNFLPTDCKFSLIYQRSEDMLKKFCNREKPWGTAHAVMCCENVVRCNFVVTNADDLYGSDALSRAAEFLKSSDCRSKIFANIAYNLYETLPESGTVSRGVITVGENSNLIAIDEMRELCRESMETSAVRCDSPVSMNLWCFTTGVFPMLRNGWAKFSSEISNIAVDEFGLPFFINSAVGNGECEVKVFHTSSKWCGVTYRTDDVTVEAMLDGR
jgi:UTP-glucose-1-phosphate uridylyltransferase